MWVTAVSISKAKGGALTEPYVLRLFSKLPDIFCGTTVFYLSWTPPENHPRPLLKAQISDFTKIQTQNERKWGLGVYT